jgi:hypothetical protein
MSTASVANTHRRTTDIHFHQSPQLNAGNPKTWWRIADGNCIIKDTIQIKILPNTKICKYLFPNLWQIHATIPNNLFLIRAVKVVLLELYLTMWEYNAGCNGFIWAKLHLQVGKKSCYKYTQKTSLVWDSWCEIYNGHTVSWNLILSPGTSSHISCLVNSRLTITQAEIMFNTDKDKKQILKMSHSVQSSIQ